MTTGTLLKEKVQTSTEKVVPIGLQVEEFLSIITSFSTLLEKETAALKKADFKSVNELQENKKFHAKRYEEKVLNLTSRRAELLNIDLKTRERLKDERIKFNTLLEANKRALLNAKESTRRLSELILESARKSVIDEKKTNYSSKGEAQSYNSATSAYSFNQTL